MAASSFKADSARNSILQWIASGEITPGNKLPPEPLLAKKLGMNHQTVRRALAQLAEEGIIVKQPRVGNFLNPASQGRFAPGIGVVLPEYVFHVMSHVAPAVIQRGVEQALDPHRFNVQTLSYKRNRFWEDAGQAVVNKGLRGVLLMPVLETRRQDIQRFIDAGIKVVLIYPHAMLRSADVHWVEVDVVGPTLQVLQRLLDLGHRRLAIAYYRHANSWPMRLHAITQFFRANGLDNLEETLVDISGNPDFPEISVGPLEARFNSSLPPTAVVVPDEVAANAIFQFCYARGIRIPRDLSVAAFNNYSPLLNAVPLTSPDSTTLQVEMVATAARQLVDLLSEKTTPSHQRGTVLGCEMQWKASIGPVSEASGVSAESASPLEAQA